MKRYIGSIIVLLPLLITGCKGSKDKGDNVDFTKTSMTAYHYSPKKKISIEAFYRDDKFKNIPHLSLKNYYNLLTSKEMEIKKVSAGQYEVKANNETATINTLQDTIVCNDFEKFISTTVYRQEGVDNVYFDGAPFLKVESVKHETAPKQKTINFKKYGIDMVGKDDDIILPVVAASNLFTGPTMITSFCTNKTLYFIDPNDSNYETSSYCFDQKAQSEILGNFKNGRRSADQAKLSYGSLCFLIDTFYGLPGREYLHDDLVNNRDLDSVLSNKSDMTKKAKEFLSSQDEYEYFAGLDMLDAFLSDAGHSVVSLGERYLRAYSETLNNKVIKVLNSIKFNSYNYSAKRNYDGNYYVSIDSAYQEANIPNNSYIRVGDTLVYRFDSFMFDLNGWIEHYKDPDHVSIPNDGLYNFKKMLDDNENDLTIKNIVLDISMNGGGFGDMVAAMMGLMTGKTYEHSRDMVGENIVTTTYAFDANFDGKFDEADKNVSYHYNYAILSSALSFSCGNLLPAEAKDNGIMLLGDKSGGGSCAVVDSTTGEGLYVRLSCQNHFVTNDNQEVEMGVEPHEKLVKVEGEEYDFSKFYDFSYISELMNEFYSH